MQHKESTIWKEYNTKKATKRSEKQQHETSEKNATWKGCNTKNVQHWNSKAWKECKTKKVQRKKNDAWRKFTRWKLQDGKSEIWNECNTERVKNMKHEEKMKSERNSKALKECNTKKELLSNAGKIHCYFFCIVCNHTRCCNISIVSETRMLMKI